METLVNTKEIPIIDLNLNKTSDKLSPIIINRLKSELEQAFFEHGTALLINHGIPEEKFKNVSENFRKFCDLPPDIKTIYKGSGSHGYIKQGQEHFQKGAVEIRDSYNHGSLSADAIPNAYVPNYRDTLVDLVTDLHSIMTLILQCIATALNIPAEQLIKMHSFITDQHEIGTALRTIYYPPVFDENNLNKSQNRIRCGAHCDYGSFTFLWQDSEGGLEICKPRTDIWRRVGHLPGAILINGGETLDIWSENRYPALKHRVVIPEEESVRKMARNSIAFFVHPKPNAPVVPLHLIRNVDPSEWNKYLSSAEYMEQRFTEHQPVKKD